MAARARGCCFFSWIFGEGVLRTDLHLALAAESVGGSVVGHGEVRWISLFLGGEEKEGKREADGERPAHVWSLVESESN